MGRDAFAVVRLEKWKRPHGMVSHWDAHVIGEDEHGLWLHSPKDSVHHLAGGKVWVVPWNGVQLVPVNGPWWVAWFWDRRDDRWTAADVATPAVFEDGRWSYLDLELDVVASERGVARIVDEDEFRDAVDAGHIDAGAAARARAAASSLEHAMTTGRGPFGHGGWRMLDLVADLDLPPTT